MMFGTGYLPPVGVYVRQLGACSLSERPSGSFTSGGFLAAIRFPKEGKKLHLWRGKVLRSSLFL